MKLLNVVIINSCLVATAVLLWAGYLIYSDLFPHNPADFHAEQIVIQTPVVMPGGELHYSIPVDKYGVYPAVISGTLISKDRLTSYALKGESGALPSGHYDSLNQEVDIPKRVNPGFYSYCRIYSYNVGTKTIVKSYETPLFEVVK